MKLRNVLVAQCTSPSRDAWVARRGPHPGTGFDPGSGIVVREDRVDRFGLSCPDDRTRLTQPYPVAEPLPREHDPVGLLFHAESCAAERARTELPANHGPQADALDYQVLLASHGDVGRPTSRVAVDDGDLVEISPDRCVWGGVENPTQMVEVEGQEPVVARRRDTEDVPSTGEIPRGRSAPHVGGRAGVTAAVSMKQRLNRAVSVSDDQPTSSIDGAGNEAGERGRLMIRWCVDLAVRGRTEVEPVVRMAAPVCECIGPGEDRLQPRKPVCNGGIRFGERHLRRDRAADVVLERYRPDSAIVANRDLNPQRQGGEGRWHRWSRGG